MQVILRTTDEVSSKETKVVSTIQTENLVKTTERAPNQKAAFRKFAAGCNLQAQCVIQDSLSDQFKAGTLQQKVQRKEIDPHTLIHKAILENSPEVIQFLLAEGVDVDYPDLNGMTPLTVALVNSCDYAVEILLIHGANANPRNKWDNMSLLEISLFMKDAIATSLLVDYNADVNAGKKEKQGILSKTIQMGWIDIAKKMIAKGAKINVCENSFEERNAPLFDALAVANRGDRSLLEIFVKMGANLNMARHSQHCTGKYTTTLLLEAISYKNLDLVKFLVESGANVNYGIKTDWYNDIRTPLKYAVETGQSQIVQYLLQHGARV
jgi:ankyrin repeat protein